MGARHCGDAKDLRARGGEGGDGGGEVGGMKVRCRERRELMKR